VDDAAIRAAMFVHLDRLAAASPDGSVRSADINTFTVDGKALRLIVQTGIWKPAGLEAALTIRTRPRTSCHRTPMISVRMDCCATSIGERILSIPTTARYGPPWSLPGHWPTSWE
jgi:hypothetical protein